MQDCASLSCPMDPNAKLSIDDESLEYASSAYCQLIGSLLYMVNSCPDIAYAMSILRQFSSKSRRSHWQAVQCVLRYVHGTLSYGINYSGGDILVGYLDMDWAECIDTHHSTLGYCFILGGGLIS